MTPTTSPRLRPLDIQLINHQGYPSLLVRDRLNLSEQYMILPQALGPALMLCDGEHDSAAIHAAMTVDYGIRVEQSLINDLIDALNEALFLQNERSVAAIEEKLEAYRAAPYRTPTIAGHGYPADAGELKALFDGYLEAAGDVDPMPPSGRALISPHIDYQRGGQVYARVWKRAAAMARAADLVVVFGADHFGGNNRCSLTRQHYATPYGVLPTATAIVDTLANAIGKNKAFAGELYHTVEHSIELVVTWLHHMRGGQAVELVPILTGSFSDFMANGSQPAQDRVLGVVIDTLKRESAGRNVLVVASGDLAHIGSVFGGEPVGIIERAELRALDDEMLAYLSAGDAEGFWSMIKGIEDKNNVCGVSPFYLTLNIVGPVEGEQAGYAVCPADEDNTSVVSVCGMVFG